MREQLEGSQAVARAVARCRPEVVSAYPISPQTHIVEALSDMVRTGELAPCEYLLVECKSEVHLDRKEIHKDETGQMNNACAWFAKTYKGEDTYDYDPPGTKRVIVHIAPEHVTTYGD